MIRLDTVKLKTSIEATKSISYGRLLNVRKMNSEGGILSDTWQTNGKVGLGVNKIEVNPSDGNILLNISAKLLQSQYIEGINKNTVEYAVQQINKLGIIEFDFKRFIENTTVLLCDVTDNIKCNEVNVYKNIYRIPLPPMYEVTYYGTSRNEGVVFKGKQKSFKERQIFYNKHKELLCSSANKDLRAILPPKLIDEFKGYVRVEGNFTTYDKIRQYIGVSNTNLGGILNSNAKPNYELFNKITKQVNTDTLQLFNEYEGYKWNEILKIEGIKGIIFKLQDWHLIEQFVRLHNPNNYRHVLPKFRQYYNSMNIEGKFNVVNEIKELLYHAA